jgi:hypothetical protein
VERATRIELAFSAWEADVLPLNYARGKFNDNATRINGSSELCDVELQPALHRN